LNLKATKWLLPALEKRAKILLIDDIDFVEATKTILESKPYEVMVAYEGDEGLRKARERGILI